MKFLLLFLLILTCCTQATSADDTNGKIVIGVNPGWSSPRFVWKIGKLDDCTFYEVDGYYEHMFMHCTDGEIGRSSMTVHGAKAKVPAYDEK